MFHVHCIIPPSGDHARHELEHVESHETLDEAVKDILSMWWEGDGQYPSAIITADDGEVLATLLTLVHEPGAPCGTVAITSYRGIATYHVDYDATPVVHCCGMLHPWTTTR